MILTPRTVLRPFCETDVTEEYLGWFHDPEVRQWITFAQEPPSRDAACAYIREKRTLPGCWFLSISICGQHIGNVKYEPDYQGGHHVGILIGAPMWRRRGIATEVLKVVTPLILTAGSWRVWLGVHQDHAVAQRAYEKAGFVRYRIEGNTWYYQWERIPCTSSLSTRP